MDATQLLHTALDSNHSHHSNLSCLVSKGAHLSHRLLFKFQNSSLRVKATFKPSPGNPDLSVPSRLRLASRASWCPCSSGGPQGTEEARLFCSAWAHAGLRYPALRKSCTRKEPASLSSDDFARFMMYHASGLGQDMLKHMPLVTRACLKLYTSNV